VLPEILPDTLSAQLNDNSYFQLGAGVLGLTLNCSAHFSDIFRAGFMEVEKGQKDAAIAAGLSRLLVFKHIILPQGFLLSYASIGNRIIHTAKNTALCMAISIREVTWVVQQIESITFRHIEITIFATFFYLSEILAISICLSILETKLKIREKFS
jgi:polar amino acid transport system permease protein